MGIYLNKLKPIFLLFVMTSVSVGIVFVVNQFKKEPIYTQIRAQEEIIIDNSSSAQQVNDTAQPEKINENNEGVVLQAATGNPGSCRDALKISSYSVCERNSSTSIDGSDGTRSGDMISKDAEIILYDVSIPLELFAGSDVKDSNRKLTSTTPIYKPAGEQIDEKVANNLLAPGTQIKTYKPWTAMSPFSTVYSTIFGGEGKTSEEGEIVVDKTIKNDCEECNNPSNVNPDKSNKISEFMNDSVYRTPGEKDNVQVSDAIESCGNNSTFVEWANDNRKMCKMASTRAAVALIKTGITDGIWNKCRGLARDENGDPISPGDECIFIEDIVVKIGSVFGSDTECPDGVCTNKYMNTRNKTALTPTDSSSYSDKVYYTTNCRVIAGGEIVTVKCAWDVSHLFKERKLSEFDDLPNIESTPNKNTYQQFLKDEAGRRSGEPTVDIF
jgi:hypothetical protein